MKRRMLVVWLLVTVLLCACGKTQVEETEPTTEPETFQICFEVQGTLVSRQELTAGEIPVQVELDLKDAVLLRWVDENGQDLAAFTPGVNENATYRAVIRPVLSNHAPYLFVNEVGLLLPDQLLTGQDLNRALNALATEEAKTYFPELPNGTEAVTGEELTILCDFFDTDAVQAAFPEDGNISRSEFAQGMNQLLGRGGDESLEIPDESTIPADITLDRQDAAALLEASVTHTPAEQGLTWSEVELPTTYEPGFVNVDGWLYYVKEDGCLLRDESVGTLYFGSDGRYTSSDAELDQMVADLLRDMIAANPEMDRMELLRVIFDHCHQNYTYRRIFEGNPEYGATGWEIDIAKDMIESGKGNCYSFAAVFWALARGIGYEPRAVSGKCLSDEQPHSWCLLEVDGEDYICDPQWQYSYTERGITKHDMFMIPREKFSFWVYKWVE